MNINRNPWRGLAAYKEPKNTDEYKYKFCGRERETKELSYLILNNLCVTIYGATGIGKTSLLQAGIFPILRQEKYVPIIVRPSTTDSDDNKTFAKIITDIIETKIPDVQLIVKGERNEENDLDYLWQYFATHRFYENGNEVFPLIVLDQFEENFFFNQEKTSYFLEQLYSLNNDNKIFPEGYHNETNFRFLISIREDSLYCLEDCIDQFRLDDLKLNRYRLTHPDDHGIRDIIEKPAGDYLPENDKSVIIEEIIKLVKKSNGGNVNTLVLSLICSLLYEKMVMKRHKNITLEDVLQLAEKPLEDYYLSLKLRKKERKYIEREFVDINGRRNSINEELVNKEMPGWKKYSESENRIFQSSNGKVELVHDMLAIAISNVKKKHKTKRTKTLLELFLLLLGMIIIFFTLEINSMPVSETYILNPLKEDSLINNQFVKKTEIKCSDSISSTSEIITISNCPNLETIKISSGIKRISVRDCINLRRIIFETDSIKEVSLSGCYNLYYIHLPEYLEDFTAYDTRIEKINTGKNDSFIWDDSFFEVLDQDYLWKKDKKDGVGRICFTRSNWENLRFPYCFRKQDTAFGCGKTFYNDGVWIDNILFNRDTTEIYGSHSPIDSVLDLAKYKKLERVNRGAFKGIKELKKLIIGGEKLSHIYSSSFLNCSIDTIIIDKRYVYIEYDFIKNNEEKIVYKIGPNAKRVWRKNKKGVVTYNKEPKFLSKEYKDDFYENEEYFIYNSSIGPKLIRKKENEYIGYRKKTFKDFSLYQTSRHEIISVKNNGNRLNLRKLDCHNRLGLGSLRNSINNSYGYIPIEIDFSSVTSELQEIVLFNSKGYSRMDFFNFPDSIRENVVLVVPYGQKALFENNPTYYGFKEIREENLLLDFYYNLKELLYRISNSLTPMELINILLFPFALYSLCLVYLLVYSIEKKSNLETRLKQILKAVSKAFISSIMLSILLFSLYWFIILFIFQHRNISYSISLCISCGILLLILFLFRLIYKEEIVYYNNRQRNRTKNLINRIKQRSKLINKKN